MKKIVFATNNKHKLEEIRQILDGELEILSLNDIGCHDDIPEDHDSLEENALQKAQYIVDRYGISCFADDTGLEVEALNGEPGVRSARYADNTDHDSEANMKKLLAKMENISNRTARFRTIIALIEKQGVPTTFHLFEGIVNGHIAREKKGTEGFGYDPIFVPDGYEESFAELGSDVKNTISHRARAVAKLVAFLKNRIVALYLMLMMSIGMSATAIGTWKSYLAYSDITEVEKAGNELFVLASNNLYMYNTVDKSITTFSKSDVLSDCGIDHIAWNKKAGKLVIVYDNENIDLLEPNGNCTNIPDYYMKTVMGSKQVNSIYTYSQYAFLATGIGILKVDVERAEINNSYILPYNILQVGIKDGIIYALTNQNNQQTVIAAAMTENLIDAANWKITTSYPSDIFKKDNSLMTDMMPTLKTLMPGGPKVNYFSFMRFTGGKLISTTGGYGAGIQEDRRGEVQVMQNGDWQIFDSRIDTITHYDYKDLVSVDMDPNNNERVIACGRSGVYEFLNGHFSQAYNADNSPLGPATMPEDKYRNSYTLVESVKFDDDGNLWMLNSQSLTAPIIELTKQGEWKTFSATSLMSGERTMGALQDLTFDNDGLLWFVNNHWTTPSLHYFDTKTEKVHSFTDFINEDGTRVSATYVRCVAIDKNNDIWIGTNMTPLLLQRSDIGEEQPIFIQVKVPRNDGTKYADYLLNGVDISAIAIDGGNRKWFGTKGNGVYLISADNITQLQHFTTENSNLLSDDIESIAIDDETGEVFFGTTKGLCSFMSDATAVADELKKDNVYAYPNPVMPDYTGLITITGLTYDADIKIVTANGSLVAEGRSNGGTFTWDGCDHNNGKRVAAGVYMVLAATAEGKKGTVCKIAIVR